MPGYRWKVLAALIALSVALSPAYAECPTAATAKPSYESLVACVADLSAQVQSLQHVNSQIGSILDSYQQSIDITDRHVARQAAEIAALKHALAELKK